jgi:hypothetical protein
VLCVALLSTRKHSTVLLIFCQVENNIFRRFVRDLGTVKVVSTGSCNAVSGCNYQYTAVLGAWRFENLTYRMNRIEEKNHKPKVTNKLAENMATFK